MRSRAMAPPMRPVAPVTSTVRGFMATPGEPWGPDGPFDAAMGLTLHRCAPDSNDPPARAAVPARLSGRPPPLYLSPRPVPSLLGARVNDLIAARLGMAMSLAFHILFAAAGITMPLLMVISEARWLRTRDPVDLELTKRWLKGTAILFAVGAVSGTVLSFELGLLWPRFMRWAGPVIGMPFSLEGFAFFLEAIFLGVYQYGWNRVPPLAHWLSGVVIAVSGCVSGIFVECANAWMNTPAGFRMENGRPVDVDPYAAMFNPAALHQTLHMTIAAYQAIAFAALGIHAFVLLRHPQHRFHRRAVSI